MEYLVKSRTWVAEESLLSSACCQHAVSEYIAQVADREDAVKTELDFAPISKEALPQVASGTFIWDSDAYSPDKSSSYGGIPVVTAQELSYSSLFEPSRNEVVDGTNKVVQGHPVETVNEDYLWGHRGKPYTINNPFDIHVQCYTHEESFKCSVCEKSFTSESLLNAHHVASHKKFDETFAEDVLSIHRRRVNEKTLKCVSCSKVFANEYALRNHRPSCVVQNPYACDHCHMKFSQKCHLQFHLHVGHLMCDSCGQRFQSKKLIDEHMWLHINKQFNINKPCKSDNEASANGDTLSTHTQRIPKKNWECDSCGERFKLKKTLDKHIWKRIYQQFNVSKS